MGPRSWCVAACAYAARYVCSVVRDSRMWCPHDIGRDSWVWGEQETLWMMNSPPELGGRSPHQEDLPVGRKRGVPWVRWLLLLLCKTLFLYFLSGSRIRLSLTADSDSPTFGTTSWKGLGVKYFANNEAYQRTRGSRYFQEGQEA